MRPLIAAAPDRTDKAMEVNHMETTMSNIHPDTATLGDETRQESAVSRPAARRFGRPGDDVVRWGEFQLALWMGAFTLTAILGGFTFLYTAVTDLRVAMETQHAAIRDDLRSEMQAMHTDIRAEMQAMHTDIRAEMQAEHTDIRAEMQAEHAEIRAEMQAEHAEIRAETDTLRDAVIDVRERVIRIETHLGTAAGPADAPEV
ncbi:MAG: hypothetical protein OXE42_06325 [Gammaproteobacteria bacterium]|nr:hypothetical protein [Gammaproteobacteria bacterium]